jgi:hypothetical protein
MIVHPQFQNVPVDEAIKVIIISWALIH